MMNDNRVRAIQDIITGYKPPTPTRRYKWLQYLLSVVSMGVGGYFIGIVLVEPLVAYALLAIFFVALSVTLSFEANSRK